MHWLYDAIFLYSFLAPSGVGCRPTSNFDCLQNVSCISQTTSTLCLKHNSLNRSFFSFYRDTFDKSRYCVRNCVHSCCRMWVNTAPLYLIVNVVKMLKPFAQFSQNFRWLWRRYNLTNDGVNWFRRIKGMAIKCSSSVFGPPSISHCFDKILSFLVVWLNWFQ